MLDSLNAISPIDGRYAKLFIRERDALTEFGLIYHRVLVEIAWFKTLLKTLVFHGKNEHPTWLHALDQIAEHFSLNDAKTIQSLEKQTNHDLKAVEYFLKSKISDIPELSPYIEFIHLGCTSEDINNLAYALMVQSHRNQVLIPKLETLIAELKQRAHTYASIPMLARTHGQAATPTTVGKEFANIAFRLERQHQQLKSQIIYGKFNGATGNYNAMQLACPNHDWQAINAAFVRELGLEFNPYTTQIESHDTLCELFSILLRSNLILMDACRDIWGYIALDYFEQSMNPNEVGSSTMPHKINPIDFENAEGNLGIANALLDHFIHKFPISRWQRDLSDSTVLRNMGLAFAHTELSITNFCKGLSKIKPKMLILEKDLNQHWEVLTEAIQTIMRLYDIPEPYEKLKSFSRGQAISQVNLHQFISTLKLPEDVQSRLLLLTPENYLGYAKELAEKI